MIFFAPIFYTLNGLWMFSNRQLFENDWVPIETNYQTRRYNHKVLETPFTLSPGSIFFVFFLIIVFLIPKINSKKTRDQIYLSKYNVFKKLDRIKD